MNDSDTQRDSLTDKQKQAARLDFLGDRSAQAIADEVGCGRTTLYRWRATPEYQAHLRDMHDEADTKIVRVAVNARKKALSVVMKGLRKISNALDADELSMHDAATGTRAALDTYKTTAAQTGISEKSRVEHSGEVEGPALQVVMSPEVAAELAGSGDDDKPW